MRFLWPQRANSSNSSPPPRDKEEGSHRRVTKGRLLSLGLSRAYDSMSQVLGLRELQDYLQGNTCLPLSSSPLWLLGKPYIVAEDGGDGKQAMIEESMSGFLADFRSLVWITYRKDFPPISDSALTSDVGWGCTLRSGQMMLAQSMLRQKMQGRRRQTGQDSTTEEEEKEMQAAIGSVTRLFWDRPGQDDHPFSIHTICDVGSNHGVVPGEWLGPYVICKSLQAAVSKAPGRPAMHVHVVAEPAGGAPTLYTDIRVACGKEGETEEEGAGGSEDEERGGEGFPRLLLVPLTLGVDKMNPVYHKQLKAVLRIEQSVGIVGGRPGSSLYFVGTQDDQLLYLDPHFTRPAASSDEDLPTFHCSVVRHMSISQMDPSLAIGFYCSGKGEFRELCKALLELEEEAAAAPLLTVREAAAKQLCEDEEAWADEACGSPTAPNPSAWRDGSDEMGGDNWELI